VTSSQMEAFVVITFRKKKGELKEKGRGKLYVLEKQVLQPLKGETCSRKTGGDLNWKE